MGLGPARPEFYLREKHVINNELEETRRGEMDEMARLSSIASIGGRRFHHLAPAGIDRFPPRIVLSAIFPLKLSGLRPWLLPPTPTLVSMEAISVPCPKRSAIPRGGAGSRNSRIVASLSASFLKPGLSSIPGSTRFPSLKERNHGHFPILKAHFQDFVQGPSNSSPLVSTKSDTQLPKSKDADLLEESSAQPGMTDTTMSAFMSEVSSLVKLVDSKDIAELHLKKDGCEILIRKKEALPQPEIDTPPMILQNQPIFQPQPSVTPIGSPPAPPAPSKALPAPSAGPSNKSSLPALKCPMAGTFYRCPAPGEPPLVKVGDKVQKGQVVCIIEAMKLMNEIEADKSGTVVEILVEDAKPVSVDMPLLIIQP